MNYLLAFLAGLSAKIYDDLNDNTDLIHFKNKYILEVSKLFHIAAFIYISFQNPLFLYIILCVVFFNFAGDFSCYELCYERSLFITILLFIPFLDNSKIKTPSVTAIVQIFILLFVTSIGAYIESTTIKEEYSYRKLTCRIGGLIWSVLIFFYFLSIYDTVCIIEMYAIGYLLVSVAVQTYCLFNPKNILTIV